MRTAVLTVSTEVVHRHREDEVGPLLAELAEAAGADVDTMEVVPSDFDIIEDRLLTYIDSGFSLVLTNGGCGLQPEDIVPEATLSVIDREVPGLAEAMRAEARQHDPTGVLTRGVTGAAGATLVINLPGTAREVRELFPVVGPVLPAAVELMRRERGLEPGR
ncbi:MAG: MogA/MoaB family molybdenum cofactor biosynthesis protein [Solirubrobacteraceae bacterium]|nr:MogA/MoaB family molybdenum cofactor biosynthesis protein [Solirubrobacteraceae bacterium]